MANYLDDYNNRKLSFGPLLQAGKMTLKDTMVYQELLYRIQVLETCRMLCKTAPVTTDTRELVGHYQLVDAVLFCAGKERAFGVPVQEQGKGPAKGRRGKSKQDFDGLQKTLFLAFGRKARNSTGRAFPL